MKKIIIINGMAQSGKDTFVELVSKHIRAENYSSVQRVKGIAKLCGWNGEKDEKSRQFLCKLKELTTEYCDMSYKAVVDRISNFYENDDKELLFVHIREPLEIQRIVDDFGAKTLFIGRRKGDIVTSNDADKYVYCYDYDYIIYNDDTIDILKEKAKSWLEQIKMEN